MSWKNIGFKEWPYILHPRPVILVASEFNGKVNVMAASWTMPISRSPPYVAIAISKRRFTYELIIKSKTFSLNILPKKYLSSIHFLGSVSGKEVPDKIVKAKLTYTKGRRLGVPIILESLVVAECTLWKDIEAGDHNVVIGKIEDIYAKPDYELFRSDLITEIPLHVGRNKYTYCVGEIISMD